MNSEFDISTVFKTVATALPEKTALIWRDRRMSYATLDARIDGIARYLVNAGLGCHTERRDLANHESGQDHLGIYLRNGNQYLETMIGSYRARVAPFNVNFRYVDAELVYLLNDAKPRALVYGAEFAPRMAAVRGQVPSLQVLIQVADDSGNELLDGAVDYESVVTATDPAIGMPTPTPDDLFLLYTGGTTGMPKGVLWRQHDIFISSMGGRPYGSDQPLQSYEELTAQATRAPGAMSMMLMLPLMHGAGQFGAMTTISMGGRLVIPDDVERLRADEVLTLAQQERVLTIPTIGDAMVRPLVEELEKNTYDLSGLLSISNSGAALTAGVRDRLLSALPHIALINGVGGSETGLQMTAMVNAVGAEELATFSAQPDTAVVSSDFSRVLAPGDGEGWLGRCNYVPLGYLGDERKSARTFPMIDGVRWSIPGDRANLLPDGRIELLGRDSMTINSGGEKIFAEEVERAVAAHPDVYDVVVVGRKSDRWGAEVVAIVALVDNTAPDDDELLAACEQHLARYKLPKAFIRVPAIVRSAAGKADYRWAQRTALQSLAATGRVHSSVNQYSSEG
jgi:3-oxocholest-4-en-26-oate---CoA ligase